MPDNPTETTTKNGIDLNTIDVSKLVLVDQDNLVQNLTSKFKEGAKQAFLEGLHEIKDTVSDVLDDKLKDDASKPEPKTKAQPGPKAGPTPGPRQDRQERQQKQQQSQSDKQIQQLRKLDEEAKKTLQKLQNLQRDRDRDKLKGEVHSPQGKSIAEDIDVMAEEYPTYNPKELQQAQQKISNIHGSIKSQTVGKEQDILSKATIDLDKAIRQEVQQRTTVLGKIGRFLDKQNINAVSMIAAIESESPMVGLAGKFILDRIREHREKRQKEKSESLKVGDLRERLPHPDEAPKVKLDNETIEEGLANKSDDVINKTLEKALQEGNISKEQKEELSKKWLHPDFVPLGAKETTAPPKQEEPEKETPPSPTTPTPVATPTPPAAPAPDAEPEGIPTLDEIAQGFGFKNFTQADIEAKKKIKRVREVFIEDAKGKTKPTPAGPTPVPPPAQEPIAESPEQITSEARKAWDAAGGLRAGMTNGPTVETPTTEPEKLTTTPERTAGGIGGDNTFASLEHLINNNTLQLEKILGNQLTELKDIKTALKAQEDAKELSDEAKERETKDTGFDKIPDEEGKGKGKGGDDNILLKVLEGEGIGWITGNLLKILTGALSGVGVEALVTVLGPLGLGLAAWYLAHLVNPKSAGVETSPGSPLAQGGAVGLGIESTADQLETVRRQKWNLPDTMTHKQVQETAESHINQEHEVQRQHQLKAEALSDLGYKDVKQPVLEMPWQNWQSKIDEKFDEQTKKSGNADWYNNWLKKKHPEEKSSPTPSATPTSVAPAGSTTTSVGKGPNSPTKDFAGQALNGRKISLEFMANAMMRQENSWNGPGKDLNNPGNLKMDDKGDLAKYYGATNGIRSRDGGVYAKFSSWDAGYDALKGQIRWDAVNRGMTLRSFVEKYAPSGSNPTEEYIEHMSKWLGGVPSNAKLTDFLSSADLVKQKSLQDKIQSGAKPDSSKYSNQSGDNLASVPQFAADTEEIQSAGLMNSIKSGLSVGLSTLPGFSSGRWSGNKSGKAKNLSSSPTGSTPIASNNPPNLQPPFPKNGPAAVQAATTNNAAKTIIAQETPPSVFAPQTTNIRSSNTNVTTPLRSENPETTYQRVMDREYVAT